MMLTTKDYYGIGRVPTGIGAVIKGWDVLNKDFPKQLSLVDFRAMSPGCPHDCFHCFTEKRVRDISLEKIKNIIDQIAEMGARGINFIGEGEPTVDPEFFDIIGYTAKKDVTPVVFTEAAKMLGDYTFAERLFDAKASVCVKCDSLFDAEYQNWVVGDKSGKYFDLRNDAINTLRQEAFCNSNLEGTTRLGMLMVLSTRNIKDVEKTLRYCRERNIWIVFSFFLPTGRSGKEDFDKSLCPSPEQINAVRKRIQQIDKYLGFDHPIWNNFVTMPCMEQFQIYGTGAVSPCTGNETVIGNLKEQSLWEIQQTLFKDFTGHHPKYFRGNCLYRPVHEEV